MKAGLTAMQRAALKSNAKREFTLNDYRDANTPAPGLIYFLVEDKPLLYPLNWLIGSYLTLLGPKYQPVGVTRLQSSPTICIVVPTINFKIQA